MELCIYLVLAFTPHCVKCKHDDDICLSGMKWMTLMKRVKSKYRSIIHDFHPHMNYYTTVKTFFLKKII